MASLGSTPGLVIAAGVGAAAATALEPAFEVPRQDAWSRLPHRILDTGTLARLVAQGGVVLGNKDGTDAGTAYAEALRDGFTADKLDRLVYLAQTVPGVGEALRILRRDPTFKALFTHSLVKQGIDPRYFDGLLDLQHERLSPQDLAYAVVRGLVDDAGLLPVAPPASGTTIKRFTVWNGDTLDEAAAGGYDPDRFRVLVGRSGLSMAPGMAAQAFFRGAINKEDFYLAIAEGDLRNEWRDAILAASHQIPTAGEYAELELRGYYDRKTRLLNTQKHGMSDADSDLLYDVQGRAPGIHAVTTGLARGGKYTGNPIDIPEPFKSSVQRGNIRPEWYGIEYANRYSYPSAFVVRALLTDGAITPDEGKQIFLDVGWTPELAHKVAKHYAPTASTAADPHVTKAETHLWTATHRDYVKREIGDSTARQQLATLGIPAGAQDEILKLWQAERAMIHAQLSPAQVYKAYKEQVPNPATGAPWSLADATAALLERGYSQNDATVLLSE